MTKNKEYLVGLSGIAVVAVLAWAVSASNYTDFLISTPAQTKTSEGLAAGSYRLEVSTARDHDSSDRSLSIQAFDTNMMKVTEARVRVALASGVEGADQAPDSTAQELPVTSPAPGTWHSRIELATDASAKLFIEIDSRSLGHADLVFELSPNAGMKLASATPAGSTHYTCPMHPSVKSTEPGQCPLCGMDLTAVTTPLDGVAHYTCPMHPSIKNAEPGQCPLCGMDLTPVSHQEQASGSIIVDDRRRQLIGLKTASVERGDLVDRLRLIGQVKYDPAVTTSVSLPLDGKIHDVFVHYESTPVQLGDPLFRFSSQALFQAETELVEALQQTRDVNSKRVLRIRAQLLAMGLTEADLAELIKTRKVQPIRTFRSPVEGIVAEIHILEGSVFWFGDPLLLLADPTRLWVKAAAYENDIRHVRADLEVEVALPYITEGHFRGSVSHVRPQLNHNGHTADVYVGADYDGPAVPANSYADVYLNIDLKDQLLIPEQAVIHAGNSRIVFVDEGEGRLQPRKIVTGRRNSTHIQVLQGLQEGETIVTSGNFLLASESRLKSGIDRW